MTSTGDIGLNQRQKKTLSKQELILLVQENLKCINNTQDLIKSNDFRHLFLNKGNKF